MDTLITGTRHRSLIEDCEEDDDYGEVVHPVGSTFVVGEALHVESCEQPIPHGEKGHVCGQMYAVLWEQALDANGNQCPAAGCKGMWTVWSADEIRTEAEEVK
jgi:hypothetical protein